MLANDVDTSAPRPYSGFWYAFLIATVLISSLLLRVGVATRSPSMYYPDEIYQTQEQAHRIAYGYSVIPWEFRVGARSFVFPAFLAGIMRTTDWMGKGSEGYLLGIAIVLSLISLTTVWFGFAWSYQVGGPAAAVVGGLACAFWYELIYFGPKALNEVLAGNLLLPSLYLGMYGQNESGRKWRLFVAALLLGTVVALRMHLAPVAIVAGFYFCRKNWRESWFPVAAGIALPILAFGMVDALTWRYPFQSYVVNFTYNIVHHRAAIDAGTRPWYRYLFWLILHEGPLPLLAIVGARRSPFLGWIALSILIPHSLIGHKEYRFMYPLLPIVVTLAAIGTIDVLTALNARLTRPRSGRAVMFASAAILIGISILIAPLFPSWKKEAGNLIAFRELSQDQALCGVALLRIGYNFSGGYTYLHRNVPIYLLPEDADLKELDTSFDAIVTPGALPAGVDGFERFGCWDGVCVYKRQGTCTQNASAYEVNEVLRRKNW
jgi:GPI mannosyltransferase 3